MSESAYACVMYLWSAYKSGEVSVRFICSKAKVAPLDFSEVRTSRSCSYGKVKEILRKELGQESIEAYYSVDSMATLCLVKNDRV